MTREGMVPSGNFKVEYRLHVQFRPVHGRQTKHAYYVAPPPRYYCIDGVYMSATKAEEATGRPLNSLPVVVEDIEIICRDSEPVQQYIDCIVGILVRGAGGLWLGGGQISTAGGRAMDGTGNAPLMEQKIVIPVEIHRMINGGCEPACFLEPITFFLLEGSGGESVACSPDDARTALVVRGVDSEDAVNYLANLPCEIFLPAYVRIDDPEVEGDELNELIMKLVDEERRELFSLLFC